MNSGVRSMNYSWCVPTSTSAERPPHNPLTVNTRTIWITENTVAKTEIDTAATRRRWSLGSRRVERRIKIGAKTRSMSVIIVAEGRKLNFFPHVVGVLTEMTHLRSGSRIGPKAAPRRNFGLRSTFFHRFRTTTPLLLKEINTAESRFQRGLHN